MTTDTQQTQKIAALNDLLRQSQLTGQVVLSPAIRLLDRKTRERILNGVKIYNAFAPQGDTQKERDFGAFSAYSRKVCSGFRIRIRVKTNR